MCFQYNTKSGQNRAGKSLKDQTAYVITSWDDTTKLDLKLADLLDKHGIKGTFYVTTGWIGKKIDIGDIRYLSEFHEIGAHTVTHPHLPQQRMEIARREILESGRMLEEILDLPLSAISFAYPYGEYTNEHLMIVKSAGFCCARTNRPFYIEEPKNLYEIPVSVWAYPHALKDLKGFFRLTKTIHRVLRNPFILKKWDCLAKQLFDIVIRRGGMFHLFGHAWQVDKTGDWGSLEDVLSYIASHRKVTYITVAEYCTLKKIQQPLRVTGED